MKLLLRWALGALALMIVPEIIPGIAVSSFVAALIAALVLGFVNAIIRPILIILTLPITVLTLGIFVLVINALLFWMVASFIPGFQVTGFWPAMFGGIVYGVLTWLINLVLADKS